MSRVSWLNGDFADAATAAVPIDDPAVRFGEGLFETMRCQGGRIPWFDRHLARLERSIAALDLTGMPSLDDIDRAASAVAGAIDGVARIRVSVTTGPTLLVDGRTTRIDPGKTLTAITCPRTWHPANAIAEHKTLSFLPWRAAQRRAGNAGADIALLIDEAGRLGEASTANVFCVIDGELVTAPATGLLPGITRSVVLERYPVREAALAPEIWREADELFATSAVRGVVPIVRVDGAPIGEGLRGALTREIQTEIDALLTAE